MLGLHNSINAVDARHFRLASVLLVQKKIVNKEDIAANGGDAVRNEENYLNNSNRQWVQCFSCDSNGSKYQEFGDAGNIFCMCRCHGDDHVCMVAFTSVGRGGGLQMELMFRRIVFIPLNPVA